MLYRKDLDLIIASGCSNPECVHDDHDELFFRCKGCDPDSIAVSYQRESGCVVVGCSECGQNMLRVAVADIEDNG
jgi:hypothetical protein